MCHKLGKEKFPQHGQGEGLFKNVLNGLITQNEQLILCA